MPAISFSTLKDKLLNGEKTQTIRPMRSDYWLRFKKGDPVYGYWKMRTRECEKLFEGVLSEDPFAVNLWEFTDDLMIRDGFRSLDDALDKWFVPHYAVQGITRFVVLRWTVDQFYEG